MKVLITAALVIFLNACVINEPVRPDDPFYAPILSPSMHPDKVLNGSLFRGNVAIQLYSDRKAMRVGDIITVILQERTSSSKSSKIGMLKNNDIDILSTPGAEGTLLGIQPTRGALGLGTNLTSEREFTGESDADQSNRLSGNISVTVVNVFPNGTLVIRGEKWMKLNRGDEYIRISGLVRPDDVSPDNTVSSNKIANARIAYSGEGNFANSQKMGWLGQFFNSPLWPF